MKGVLFLCGLCALVVAGCHKTSQAVRGGKEVQFDASDGVKVYGDYYTTTDPKGIILMFHQAKSSSLEYAPIAPMAVKDGYDCLAIDQRSGGDLYGQNRTVTKLGKSTDYMSAYKDLEAALDWAKAKKYKQIIVWGSSYSASLSIRLASEHPEIAGLIAFSPGEYFDDNKQVEKWCGKLNTRFFFICTSEENAVVSRLVAAIKNVGGEMRSDSQFVHGSSTLRQDVGGQGRLDIWKSLEKFLSDLKPKQKP